MRLATGIMTQATRLCDPNSLKINRQEAKLRKWQFFRLSVYFLVTFLCIIGSPIWAKVPEVKGSEHLAIDNIIAPVSFNDSADLLQQGKVFYHNGRFAESVQVLKQAVEKYQQQGDRLKLATSLSNLSLAYQELGAWTQAQQAITQSLNLLPEKRGENQLLYAKSLDIQGRLQLAMGQPQAALKTWQQTALIYTNLENHSGVVRSLINQAQGWRTKGAYRRSVQILQEVNLKLQSQPDSIVKAVGLRSLGDALIVVGNLQQSRTALEQSLVIAQNLQSKADMGASLLSLGNNAQAQLQKSQAIAYYQQAVQTSPSPLTKVQAQLNHLSLLIPDQLAKVEVIIPLIQSQVKQLPPSRASIYAQINFAQSLIKLPNRENSPSSLSTKDIAILLANAIQQSRSLGDKRAEAHALGSLGGLYEQTKQWTEAEQLTKQALILAQTHNAPEIAYRLDWQLGRLLWVQQDITGAIAAYDAAVDTLHSLRNDLVAINQDVQFNFRDSVEPIYRQSVELLLESKSSEKILDKIRQRIEALQLAELDNFFREACLQGQNVSLDKVVDQDNPTAAILYPIILPEQIQVIVKIPNQPLQHYKTDIAQTQVEKIIADLRKNLVNPVATKTLKIQSQQVYNWLIKPIESQLTANQVTTLVFVLDGALRNLPMASVYDGKQYLVEKYAIALSVGLQLLDPKPLVQQELKALTAGLTQPPPEFGDLTPLPAIKSEMSLIAKAGVLTTSLLDQQFTRQALETKVNTIPFNVVHLATHGQFSSRADQTFILAADGPINVTQFDSLLRSRDATKPQPVELLFLSACQTATGDNRATLGLAGAAVRAGARSTLASLWQIDDESTAMFVGAFYQELKSGKMTKAEALRHAQIKLLQHPNYNAPSFWSAYVLIGNWL